MSDNPVNDGAPPPPPPPPPPPQHPPPPPPPSWQVFDLEDDDDDDDDDDDIWNEAADDEWATFLQHQQENDIHHPHHYHIGYHDHGLDHLGPVHGGTVTIDPHADEKEPLFRKMVSSLRGSREESLPEEAQTCPFSVPLITALSYTMINSVHLRGIKCSHPTLHTYFILD
jgi:hypothetical protein